MLLAREGASAVLIGDRDIEAADKVVRKCIAVATNSDFRAEAVKVDVSKEDSVRGMFQHMVDTFGRLDYVVNSVGVSVLILLDQMSACRLRLPMKCATVRKYCINVNP